MRKFRKLKDLCTAVDEEDRVLFAVDLDGHMYKPIIYGIGLELYKYETVRKYNDLGCVEWKEVVEK